MYLPFAYSVVNDEEKSVVFEKLPSFDVASLDEAVELVHEPNLIESIVRVRSKQPYSTRGTVLPHFGYRLIGK
jgi:hypothetical protein